MAPWTRRAPCRPAEAPGGSVRPALGIARACLAAWRAEV